MSKIIWIPEKEAAAMINKAPRTLRRKVANAEITVARTTIGGKKYLYSKNDLEKALMENSTAVRNV